jgi:class 3 adenylate cyclase/CHASE2 domain-containing sensor protein
MHPLRQRIADRRLWRSLAGRAGMLVFIVLLVALLAPRLSFIEVRALDVLYALRPVRQPDPRIELIDIGGDASVYDSLRDPREPSGSGCETPRLAYAEAVRRLSRWGAKVIVFDLMFGRSCEYEDEQLAEAFRAAGNVIVAATSKTKPGAVSLQDPVAPIDEAVWGVGSPVGYRPHATVRSVPLLVRDRDTGREYLSLSLVAFQYFEGEEAGSAQVEEGRWLRTAGRRVPVLSGEKIHLLGSGAGAAAEGSDASAAVEIVRGSNVEQIPGLKTWNTLLVNWVGPQGTFLPHRLSDVLAFDYDAAGRRLFAGKAVIIGKMDWDAHWTAVGAMPGPEIQANALNTLMSGDFIRPISSWGMISLLIAFVLATSSAVRRFKGVRAAGAVLFVVVVSVVVARQLMMARGVWTYLFYCQLGVGLTWGMTVVVESDKVTSLLTRFVPSFMGRPETPGVGEVREMDASILFSDIRGFTGMAEQFSAAETLTMLNTFQSALEEVITSHGGTIVKTPGDAILAVFWEEVNGRNHAACALRSGQEILRELPSLGRSWEAAGVKLAIGIGIDAGQVAMGLVGKRHLEPTVIGDAVNVAQRLETLTKTLECPLVFSENVRERLREEIAAVCFDEVTVRGRETPLRVYGVPGPDGLPQELERRVDLVGKEKTE